MRPLILCLGLFSVVLLAGCARTYDILGHHDGDLRGTLTVLPTRQGETFRFSTPNGVRERVLMCSQATQVCWEMR